MSRRRRPARFIPVGVTIIGAGWMLAAATDTIWNGLDLIGLVIFLLGFMRVLRPVRGGARG